ncbi:Zinc carboxypeptidase [Mycena venus]|uniref:Zinc carboxypeptidase n=1 Tax=Mycena venus TaxID=2733690 RepID=A0A8H6Z2U8_9AGAR|nr:Zinc carboxypeptidase [Mycena venus]
MRPSIPSITRFLLFSALVSLPLSVVGAQSHDQHVFGIPTPQAHGILRRFIPEDAHHLAEVLRIAETHELDIWKIGTESSPHVDIYSPPSSAGLPDTLLATRHTTTNINIPLPEQRLRPADWNLTSLQNTTFHGSYHSQSEVDTFIGELARLHPESVQILKLGHSGEEREMLGMKIAKPPAPGDKQKLGFVVLGPQHAREWVATSTALYIAHALLANASEPNSLAALLDVYVRLTTFLLIHVFLPFASPHLCPGSLASDFHIIPSPNPDGYVHTWDADRFWYKNRQIVGPGAKCIGIDMNRNWGSHWKPHAKNPLLWDSDFSISDLDDEQEHQNSTMGTNKKKANKGKKSKKNGPADPCSHWYPGHRAFEAPEVNNLANYITKVNGIGKGAGKGGIVAFLDLRSYGQMLAAPYSYKCTKLPKDAEDQMEALLGAAQAAKSVYGTQFQTGTVCELLYRAPGNILDYIYTTASIKYTYAAFLRDTGTYGFAIPPEWIRPVGEETGVMVEYLARFIAKQRGIIF